MSTWSVTDARAALPEILAKVAGGEEVTLTRRGRPVAVIVRPDSLRSRRATAALRGAEELAEQLNAARVLSTPPPSVITEEWAEELIAEIRAGRDVRS